MINLFDRDDERKVVESIFSKIDDQNTFAIFIEGAQGTGKSCFLEYIIKTKNLNVFKFKNHGNSFNCTNTSMENEYEYITAVIYEIQKDSPQKFQSFIQNYFDNQNRITFLDACCQIMPNFKIFSPIQDLLKNKYNNIDQSRSDITSRLESEQLIDFFSELILNYFCKIKKIDNIVFSIDNIQWLDESSLKTLISLIIKTKQNSQEHNINISFIMTSNISDELSDDSQKNYKFIYKQLKEFFNISNVILMHNFNLSLTRGFLKYYDRPALLNIADKIYDYTKGNPSELIFALRFSDDEIKLKLKGKHNTNDNLTDAYFTTEKISEIYHLKNKNHVYILNILSVLPYAIRLELLITIVSKVTQKLYNNMLDIIQFKDAISYLYNEDIIENNNNNYAIKQNNVKAIIINYLQESEEYLDYADIIAEVLFKDDNSSFKENFNYYCALSILKNINAKKCFEYFILLISKNLQLVNVSILEIASQAFCSDISNISNYNLNNIVIVHILPALFNAGKYNAAKNLSDFIYIFKDKVTGKNLITYLLYYTKTLIELSLLISDNSDEKTAVTIFEELEALDINDTNLHLQIYLLGMSVYEHLLDFDKINALYSEAFKLVNLNSSIQPNILATFYRNKGLYFSHRNLIDDYKLAINYAKQISIPLDRNIMIGTSQNNLGLAYFYRGEISEALDSFKESLKILEVVNCNVARIHNNIGICQFLLGNIDDAYKSLSISIMSRTDGAFVDICTQANYALVIESMGDTKQAIKILDSIIDEYNSGTQTCKDEVAYSSAMLNRAYIHIKNNEYFDAMKLIKCSTKQKYRYEKELQETKRDNMIKYCMLKENLSCSFSINDIQLDITDKKLDIFSKLYSLIPFAYYVI